MQVLAWGMGNREEGSAAGLHSQSVLVTSGLLFKGQVTGCLLLQEAILASPPSGQRDHIHRHPPPQMPHRDAGPWPALLSAAPQHKALARTGANTPRQAGRIQGRNFLDPLLLCDVGQVPNPLWALVSSFRMKNQPDLMGIPI